jgi:hypothetical protein
LYPTPEQIPTAQEMQALTDETEQLREQLWDVQRRRTETTAAINQLEVAEQLADMARSTLKEMQLVLAVSNKCTISSRRRWWGVKDWWKSWNRRNVNACSDDGDNDDCGRQKEKGTDLGERYQEECKTFSNSESLRPSATNDTRIVGISRNQVELMQWGRVEL